MKTTRGEVQRIVSELHSGAQKKQIQAALELRNLATDTQNKDVIREAGGIEVLLQLLNGSRPNVLTTVCVETVSCLAVDDLQNREAIRASNGIRKLVGLLSAGPDADCTHRALLALRILTTCEADRIAILKAGGVDMLVQLLGAGSENEVTEFAAAALGNLAAGGHVMKDAIREAGGIEMLVRLLKSPDAAAAELAAVALRNLSLQNRLNKDAIVAAEGLLPLIQLLSAGRQSLVQPLQCEAMYKDVTAKASSNRQHFVASQCCFDPRNAELCIASHMGQTSKFGCLPKTDRHTRPTDKTAERYSLLRKLTMTEPDARTLEISFFVAGNQGAPRLVEQGQQSPARWLQKIIISPCPAAQTKGAVMRMLTRMHLEKEFEIGRYAKPNLLHTGPSFDAMSHITEILHRAKEAITA